MYVSKDLELLAMSLFSCCFTMLCFLSGLVFPWANCQILRSLCTVLQCCMQKGFESQRKLSQLALLAVTVEPQHTRPIVTNVSVKQIHRKNIEVDKSSYSW